MKHLSQKTGALTIGDFKQRTQEVAEAIKATCPKRTDIVNMQHLLSKLLLIFLISFGAFAQNNGFQVTMEQPPAPTVLSYEEIEARHKKSHDVEHELHDYIETHPNDIKALYLYAKISKSHDSYWAIAKCISLDPNNLDYRKVRANKLLREKAQEAEMLLAIDDLQFVNENGGEHHKTHSGMAMAYSRLADDVLRYRRPKHIERDPFGDNEEYNQAQIAIYQRRIDLFVKAREHYQKALALGADHSRITKSELPYIEESIANLEQLIKDQPNKN